MRTRESLEQEIEALRKYVWDLREGGEASCTPSASDLVQLSPMELMQYQDRLSEREVDLLREVYLARSAAERAKERYERERSKNYKLQDELSEARSGLRLPTWARRV